MTGSFQGLGPIGQIACTVSDLDSAVQFYRDKLGLRFLFQAPNLAFFDCNGVRLMLAPPEGSEKTSYNSILYFKVENIQEATKALKARGVIFEHEPRMIAKMPDHELWLAAFRDPDQNPIELMSEVRS